ncbi:DUF4190 domain-containing protein [Kitasatospora griseola]|uniref:DUF4190 domain-containing protein n=1 Tax=Kitasatospora griseola TaxID=2064 RepID=UPI0038108096
MSFDQERSGEAGPDAARNDSPTTPATPATPAPDAPDAEAAAPAAISFAKQPAEPETSAPVDAPPDPVAPPVPPAPSAPPAPANPWALPSAPPPVPGAAPVGAPLPPGANPWAAAPPGGHVPLGAHVPPGAPGPVPDGGNPWAAAGGQQPWGTGGYPPPGMPGMPGAPGGPMMYPAPQRSLYTNNLAIASLIVGIVCCYFGFIGIGLGIGALRQIKRTGERGKGLAISGIVAGSLGMVLFVLSVIGGAFSVDDFEEDGSRPSHVSPTSNADLSANSPFRLYLGQCFDRAAAGNAKPVDCASAHFGETYWTQPSAKQTGAYPGEDVMEEEAEKLCADRVDTYVADTWSIPDKVVTFYFYPDRAAWKAPAARRIVCFLANEDKSSRTGMLQKYASSLTADQRQLLDATNQFDKAWGKGPDEETGIEEDPQAYRTWAKDMSAAANRQATMLANYRWTTADKATVDRLVAKSRIAATHYQLAAQSTDSTTLRIELGLADDNLGDDEIISLRRALGLATQQEEPAKRQGGNSKAV